MSAGNEGGESRGRKWTGRSTERSRGTAPQGNIGNGSRGRIHHHQQRQPMTKMALARTITVSGGTGGKNARPELWHTSRHQHTKKSPRSSKI